MRSLFLAAAALTAFAGGPATAESVAATLTSQELQTLIPGNELTAASKYGGTYTDAFRPDGRTNIVTGQLGVDHAPRDPMHPIYKTNDGTWSIEGNKLCRQIFVVNDGQKYCVDVVRARPAYQVIYPRGRVEDVTFKNSQRSN